MNRRGVRLDRVVEPTFEGIAAVRDEALETALRIISGQGGS